MAQYRKKPVVIEAFNWTGGPDQTEDPEWICDAMRAGSVRFENAGTPDVAMLIDTLEGTHRANQGDWIIRGHNGELYPCKPDIFFATYEAVWRAGMLYVRQLAPNAIGQGSAACGASPAPTGCASGGED